MLYSLEIKLVTGEAYIWHELTRQAAMAIMATYADVSETVYLSKDV